MFLALGAPASAQVMLPGALKGHSSDGPPAEAGAAPVPHAANPTLLNPPSEDTILGLALKHDGTQGVMSFDKSGSDLTLTKLTLTGDKISKPTESCTVDVAMSPPIVTRPMGRPVGANRFDVPVPLCPFVIDVLDGAALVSPAEPTCEIKAADCGVTPTGLWGPSAAEISPQRAEDLEHDRVRLETMMRTNFRALVAHAGKDRAAVKDISKDQAGFSSDREVTCRDYDQESAIGFCSTQITEARALALISQFKLDAEPAGKPKPKPKVKPRSRPKPVAAAPGADPGPTPAGAADPDTSNH